MQQDFRFTCFGEMDTLYFEDGMKPFGSYTRYIKMTLFLQLSFASFRVKKVPLTACVQ